MKEKIHPTYFEKAKVVCSCGSTFSVGSTQELIETEVCSACHPFYTKKDRSTDQVGQIQKFKARLLKAKKKA
ncbi:MAG: 50S ribosomal protein L31 [bacterium]|nr:50S ribosomal protein L31 [bacterium]